MVLMEALVTGSWGCEAAIKDDSAGGKTLGEAAFAGSNAVWRLPSSFDVAIGGGMAHIQCRTPLYGFNVPLLTWFFLEGNSQQHQLNESGDTVLSRGTTRPQAGNACSALRTSSRFAVAVK